MLIVLSGTSGVGKDAVLSRLKESDFPLTYIVTITTRKKRPREKNNVDYHFISKDRFQEMIEKQELLEWATVYDNWYGVPRQPVKQALDQGQDVIIKVDTQGAMTIKRIVPQAVSIILIPQSMEELDLRLNQRGTESPGDLALRLKVAEEEIKQIPSFDYIVVNCQDEIDSAVSEIKAIITAEKRRVEPRRVNL
ncbi:guanylate kinase [Chloroflexota bacterium]